MWMMLATVHYPNGSQTCELYRSYGELASNLHFKEATVSAIRWTQ
jgi:hypothetical protein